MGCGRPESLAEGREKTAWFTRQFPASHIAMRVTMAFTRARSANSPRRFTDSCQSLSAVVASDRRAA